MYRVLGVCFVCQFIHYHVLVLTCGVAVKMAVMYTYCKINVHVCVMGVSGQVINDCQGSPDAGRPARHRVRGPPHHLPSAAVAALIRARRRAGGQ